MNKTFVTSLVTTSLLSIPAQAKTEGSYVGVDLLKTKATYYEEAVSDGHSSARRIRPSSSGHSYGLGLNYKYAFNFNGFFVAPGVIAEHNNNEFRNKNNTKKSGQYGQGLSINNRYGMKADIGYDVTETVSPYLTLGYSLVSYDTRNNSGTDVVNRSASQRDVFYGIGTKFNLSQNTALNLEYNTQNFAAKTTIPNNTSHYAGVFKTRLDVIKLGLSYRF